MASVYKVSTVKIDKLDKGFLITASGASKNYGDRDHPGQEEVIAASTFNEVVDVLKEKLEK